MEESVEKQLGRLLEGGEQRTKALVRIEAAMLEDRKLNSKTRDIVLGQQAQMLLLSRLVTFALACIVALGTIKGFEWFGGH